MREYRFVGEQEYEIELYYDLGGVSYFTGNCIKRGYRLTIMPIRRLSGGGRVASFDLFESKPDELRLFLLEVKRKSVKKEKEAIELARPYIEEHFKTVEAMRLTKI